MLPSPTPQAEPAQLTEATQGWTQPPQWFQGGAHSWMKAKKSFEIGCAMDKNGAQHAAVGVALSGLSVLACLVAHGFSTSPACACALGVSGVAAVVLGQNQRAKALPLMTHALIHSIARSANPGLNGEGSEEDRKTTEELARQTRLESLGGSFEELAAGIAEGRCARKEIIAPIRWLGGMAFKRFGKSVV